LLFNALVFFIFIYVIFLYLLDLLNFLFCLIKFSSWSNYWANLFLWSMVITKSDFCFMLLAFCPLLWNFTICIQFIVFFFFWTSSCGSHWANLYLSYLICNMELHQLSICPVKFHSTVLILINESYCICVHIGVPHLLGLCLTYIHTYDLFFIDPVEIQFHEDVEIVII
jgi:hypothetical protein